MAVKIWALGPRGYSADRFNVFDGIIVLFSLLELLLSAFGSVESLGGVVSSLRFFRLLRVVKLVKVCTSYICAREQERFDSRALLDGVLPLSAM